MASFHQWRKSLIRHPEPRQITFVCGAEIVLVEEVVAQIKRALDPHPWNYVTLSAGEVSERLIWAELEQHPLDHAARLVVIRNAENLKDIERFQEWVRGRTWNPRTYMLLVSNEERVPKTVVTEEERKKGVRPEVVPHLKSLGTKGYVIECRPFTSTTAPHSISWVQSKVKMSDQVARHLMERSNFELGLVRDICVKLSVFPGTPTISVVNELLTERPRDSFVDALFAQDKRTALLALQEIPESEYGRVIGQIDAQLDLVGMLHDMQNEYKGPGEMARAAGSQAFLIPDLLPSLKYYDSKHRYAIRKLLAIVDSTNRGGVSTGTMEALTALW